MRRVYELALGLVAALLGIGIAYVDSRPNWDDTGITVGALLLVTALLGFLGPAHAWRWALLVGIWVPVFNLALNHAPALAVVLVFPFAGAYAGAFARRALQGALASLTVRQ